MVRETRRRGGVVIEPRYQSDRVTLYCADALQVMELLPDRSIQMVFSDPPYGHNNNNNGDLIHRREAALGVGKVGEARPIANDGVEATELFEAMLSEARRVLDKGCCCCCCGGGGGPDPMFARWSMLIDKALDFVQMVVWDKGPMGMGWRYRRSYETVLVGCKPGKPMRWYDETDRIENIIRHITKVIPQADEHPTQKPVELAAHFIALHSQPGDVILDPFAGSGSTGVAAVRMGRRFIGVEIDEHWYSVAERRIRDAEAQLLLPGVT